MRPFKHPLRLSALVAGIAAAATVAAAAFSLPQIPSLPNVPSVPGVSTRIDDAAQQAVYTQAARALAPVLATQTPLFVDARADFPTTPTLPGGAFRPVRIDERMRALLAANSDGTITLSPGDYALATDVYCLKAGGGSPNGLRYVLAPLRGARAAMLDALAWRATVADEAHWRVQSLSWALQGGMKYADLAPEMRKTADRLIPDYRSALAQSLEEKLRDRYAATVARVPNAPAFDALLARTGPVAQAVANQRYVQYRLLSTPLNEASLTRALIAPGGDGERGPTPWSRTAPNVYERFTTSGNFHSTGLLEIRVTAPANASAFPLRIATTSLAPSMLAVNPSHVVHVPITGIFGNPLRSLIQPLAMAGAAGAGMPKWKVTVKNRDGKPGGWKELKSFGFFMHGGRSIVCPVTIGIPIISEFGMNTDNAANEAVETYVPAAAQETTDWLNTLGDFTTNEETCAHFRNALQNHMQGSFPGARVQR